MTAADAATATITEEDELAENWNPEALRAACMKREGATLRFAALMKRSEVRLNIFFIKLSTTNSDQDLAYECV
jgi:hypothetical protein